jgi:succinylglutamate desuccinylase
LQRGSVHLFAGRRRLEIEERTNVPAHGKLSLIPKRSARKLTFALLVAASLAYATPELRIAAGTRFETSLSERTGPEPGPTVLVVGGIHGNEPAPPHAVRALERVQVRRGRLLLVAEANRQALATRSRFTPGDRFVDLNRSFPIASQPAPRGVLATALWRVLERNAPDWVIDVHEGYDFHSRNSKSVGSSVTYVPHARVGVCSGRLARQLVDGINSTIDDPAKKFVLLAPGPEGSFARSATEARGIPSLVLETTRGQPLELRVSQHEALLGQALERIGLTSALRPAVPCGRIGR